MNKNQIIAVFCYKRMEKLRESMSALLRNPEAADSEIIFICDGFKNENDKPGVLATRAYIESLEGFKKVHTIYRSENYGIHSNFSNGLKYLCSNFEAFIVVEDDIVVSDNFLRFMNDGLAFYKNRQSVFAITGFCFPLKEMDYYQYDSCVHWRMSIYGWASWSDRIREVKLSNEELKEIIRTSPNFKNRLNREGRDLFRMVKKQINGTISTWDVQLQVYVCENNKRIIYPVKSKTTNIGFGNESTHTSGINYFVTTLDDSHKRTFRFCDENLLDENIIDQLRVPYKYLNLVRRKLLNEGIKLLKKIKPG